jgi:hypothetical protein
MKFNMIHRAHFALPHPLIGVALLSLGCQPPTTVESYLAIIHITPAPGSANVSPTTSVSATFSEALDDDSISPISVWIEDANGDALAETINHDTDTWTLSVVPEAPLETGQSYTAVFSTDLVGSTSGHLLQEVRSTFWVGSGGGGGSGNTAPVADAGPDATALVGETVTLDGSASQDADGDELVHTWALLEIPPESKASLDDPNAVTPSFLADQIGIYTAVLMVNDGESDADAADYVQVEAFVEESSTP